MKKFLSIILAMSLMVIGAQVSFAALADVNTSVGADDVYEINNATPGTSKTFLGTRLGGVLSKGATTFAANENTENPDINGGTTPTTTVFLKTTGAGHGEAYILGNAVYDMAKLTLVMVSDGGKDFTVTPKTKTGFTSAVLDDAKDSCTLLYINSTVGWIVQGNAGCTIN